MANDTDFGLISYVFSSNLTRALRTAEAMESGMVAINKGVISDPAAPLDGYSIKYTLSRTGCWFEATNQAQGVEKSSWNRFGWGKKAKRRALPDFFAKTEADILMPEEL